MSSSSSFGWTSRLDVRDHLQHLLLSHQAEALPAKVAAYLASLDPGEHIASRSPSAIEEAWQHADRLSPEERTRLLVDLAQPCGEAEEAELVERLYQRFRHEDRFLLASDRATWPLVFSALQVTSDRRASRLALIDAWASASGAERAELLEAVADFPELVDFVAARPAALEEAALALALPFRVLVEHLGPVGLRRRIVTRVLMLREVPGTVSVDQRAPVAGAARRAVKLLASFPDAPRTACHLLAALEDEAIDGRDAFDALAPLVALLWRRDRAQTVDLGRAALRRGKHDWLAREVLACVERAPREEDRPFLDEAIAVTREGREWLIERAVAALVRLGAPAATWQRVAEAIVEGHHHDLGEYMAIATADDTAREARLITTMLDARPTLLRLAALEALARVRPERRLAVFERAMTTNLCCGLPGCTQVAEHAVEVVVAIGTADAFAALVRAFVALERRLEHVVEAIAEGIVSLAGRLP
jgi:hypothetical protein